MNNSRKTVYLFSTSKGIAKKVSVSITSGYSELCCYNGLTGARCDMTSTKHSPLLTNGKVCRRNHCILTNTDQNEVK